MNLKRIVGLCAIAMGLVLCASGLWILSIPTEYQATVKIEIESADVLVLPVLDLPGSSSYTNFYDPYFYVTFIKPLNSDMVLSNVVETLGLNAEWGKRFGSGRTLETAETILLLKQRMNLRVPPNSRIIEVRVRDEDANEGAGIANAIAEAYKDYRIAQHSQQMTNEFKMLDEDYAKEEAKILLMQSNVDRLYGQLRIIDDAYKNSVSTGPVLTLDQRPELKEVIIRDEADYKKLTNELAEFQSIQATNPAVSRNVLAVMSGDDVLPDLLRQLDDKMRKLGAETNGVEGTSSDRAAIQASIVELNQKIDARVGGIMITLRARSDYAKTASDALSKMLEEIETVGRPYWKAKDKLDQEKETCELLKAKIQADKEDMTSISRWIPATVIDPAVPPNVPLWPDHRFGAVLLVCGLATSGFGFYSLRNAGIKEETAAKPV